MDNKKSKQSSSSKKSNNKFQISNPNHKANLWRAVVSVVTKFSKQSETFETVCETILLCYFVFYVLMCSWGMCPPLPPLYHLIQKLKVFYYAILTHIAFAPHIVRTLRHQCTCILHIQGYPEWSGSSLGDETRQRYGHHKVCVLFSMGCKEHYAF